MNNNYMWIRLQFVTGNEYGVDRIITSIRTFAAIKIKAKKMNKKDPSI